MAEKPDGGGLFDKLGLLSRMYDLIRLVDPVEKRVLTDREKRPVDSETTCYGFWKRGTFCRNCISLRAYMTGEPQYKLEYSPTRVCQVTAVPAELGGRSVVVEILKDITRSFSVSGAGGEDDVTGLIDRMNLALMQDPLTGVYNRRFLSERLYVDMVNAVLRGSRFAVLMGDIDRFKDINDRHGHRAGDAVLRNVAQTLRRTMREGDWVARYGGDEFVVCLYGARTDDARRAAERLLGAVQKTVTRMDGTACVVTMSFGLAVADGSGAATADDLLESADRSLYIAKRAGGNRVGPKGGTVGPESGTVGTIGPPES